MKPFAMLAVLCLALVSGAHAGDGHDHGDAPAAANSNGPRRLPGGDVFLPKPAQRQLGVRTLPVESGALPRAFELAGKVVMDPNTGGRVQALITGRVLPGPRGLPLPGQAVTQGEVLAYVVAEMDGVGRSLAEHRARRLRALSGSVPRKQIEEAESQLAREKLTAPVSGVIASAHAVTGQVVEAREILYEIVNPERLLIEALAYDTAQALDVASGSLAVGDAQVPLTFVGAARSLREQALPLLFRGEGDALSSLAVGQPVRVLALTRSSVQGLRVPTVALVKNPANQTIVWVKTAPEHFEPRTVTLEPLDGASVAVTSGLRAGDRVVVRAATLVNQLR